jgi:glutaredoxin 3
MQDPIRLSVAEAAEHDPFGLYASGHAAIFCEVLSRVTLYTTEPCGFCRVAKSLLSKRNVPYAEVNLAKDPSGRAELVRLTGMMTFPQVVIDDEPIGGYQELVQADRTGRLADLAAEAAA